LKAIIIKIINIRTFIGIDNIFVIN